jgi:hypothetical protein
MRSFGHYPFGETWYETGTASKCKFTSYERDPESLNDYAILWKGCNCVEQMHGSLVKIAPYSTLAPHNARLPGVIARP